MFNKKHPVITASNCSTLEMLRTAVEVLTGNPVRYECIDFNTCKCKITIGFMQEVPQHEEVSFIRSRKDLLHFLLGGDWHVALFVTPLLVKVENERNPRVYKTIAGDFTMRWIGSCLNDRREEPLFLKEALYCAEVRNLTLEQLLIPKPA